MATGFVGQAWVQISPSFEGFQKQVSSEITKQLKGAGESAGEEAGKESGSKFSQAFSKAGAVVGKGASAVYKSVVDISGIAAVGLTGFAVKAAKAGEEANTLASVMQVVGKNTGLGGKAVTDTAQSVQNMGVNFQVADKFATSLARSNLGLTNATKLTTIAQNAGVVSGQSTSDALSAITKGILTLQPRQLKNVGLTVDAAAAYKAEAKQLGIKTNALTITQKRQALMNAVMQSGASINGVYAKALDEPKISLNLMKVAFENITATIGQTFEPAIGKALKPWAEFVLKLQAAVAPGGKLRPIVDAIGQGISRLIGPIGSLGTKMGTWITQLKAPQIQKFAAWISKNLPTVTKFGLAMGTLAGKNLLGGLPVIGEFVGRFNPLVAIMAEIVATSPKLRAEFLKVVKAIEPIIPPLTHVVTIFIQDLLPTLLTLVQYLVPAVIWVANLTTSFLDLIEPIKPLADLIGGALTAAFIAWRLSMLGNPWFWVASAVVLSFIEMAKVSKPMAIAVLGVAAAFFIWAVAAGVLESIPVVALIVAIALAVISLVLGIIWLVKNWDTVWAKIKAITEDAWKFIDRIFQDIANWFINLYNKYIWPVVRDIIGAWNSVGAAFDWVWNHIIKPTISGMIQAWHDVANAISAAWNNVIWPIIQIWEIAMKVMFAIFIAPILIAIWYAWVAMSWAIKKAWTDIIQPTINAIVSAFRWLWNNVLQPVWSAIQTGWGLLTKAIAAAWQWLWNVILKPIFNAFSAAWAALVSAFNYWWVHLMSPVIHAIVSAFQWWWNNIIHPIFTAFSNVWSGMANGFKQVYTTTIQWVFDHIESGIQHTRDVFKAAVSVISGAFNGLKDAVAIPARWIVNNIINPLINGANHLLDKVHLHIDPIPKFAEGGKVPGQGNADNQLALLTPGEWVLTKSQARAIGYSRLSGLPRYAEGGPVGAAPLGINLNPISWGKGAVNLAVGGFKDLEHIGDNVVNEATGLLRFAAVEAFKAFTVPILKMLEGPANNPPDLFTGALAKLGILAIQGLTSLIAGHGDASAEVGGTSAMAVKIMAEAAKQIGKPYVWGARGPNTFDCSGLVDWSYGTAPGSPKVGWTGPRVGPTTLQQQSMGKQVPTNQAAAADLWFFGNPVHHVGLATGAGTEMIHAPHTGAFVELAHAWSTETNFVRRLIMQSANSTAPGVGGPVARWAPVVDQALKILNQPITSDAVNGVLQIISHESGGNPNAVNNWDSNAQKGTPSKGLMQVIGPTFFNYHVFGTPDNILDPLANIAAGINYAITRYGSLMNVPGIRAVLAGGRYVGYDSGGWLPPGESFVVNKTGKPEPILTAQQWDAIQMNAQTNGQGGPALHIENAQFNEPVDASLLMSKVEFAVQAGRL
jgi:NlpC/P60 family/Transglycosylase SLT domain